MEKSAVIRTYFLAFIAKVKKIHEKLIAIKPQIHFDACTESKEAAR